MTDRYSSNPSAPRSARGRAGGLLAVATAVAAVALAVAGCSKSASNPDANASSASSTQPSPAASNSPDSNNIVPLAKLAAIMLPVPKGAPASGLWINASSVGNGDGERLVNFVDGNVYWVRVRFADCNLPAIKNLQPSERGETSACFDAPTGKLQNYPLFARNAVERIVKVGHLIIVASIGGAVQTKLTTADLEAFLGSLDLASIAKL